MHKRESLEGTTLILMCKGFSYVRLGMAITFKMYLLWLTVTGSGELTGNTVLRELRVLLVMIFLDSPLQISPSERNP
jgi:hypothetical protein